MTGGNKIIQVYSPLHDFHPHSVVLPALDKPRFLMHMTLVGHGRLSASRLAQIQVKKNTCSCILFRSVIVEVWILCPKTCTLCPKTGFEYLNWTESLFCLGLSVSSPYWTIGANYLTLLVPQGRYIGPADLAKSAIGPIYRPEVLGLWQLFWP